MVSLRKGLAGIAFIAAAGGGCASPPEDFAGPGIALAAERSYRPGEKVRFYVAAEEPVEARVTDGLGNLLYLPPLRPLNTSTRKLYYGDFRLLEPLTDRYRITAAGFRKEISCRPAYPARLPVVLAGGQDAAFAAAWVSSGLCRCLPQEAAMPPGELFRALVAGRTLRIPAEARALRRIAGCLAALRSLARPLPESDVTLLDAAGNPVHHPAAAVFRLDTARVIFLELGQETGGPLRLHRGRESWWYEPSRGISLGRGHSALLYRRPARLTAVTALQYEVKRVEVLVRKSTAAGFLLRVEVVSPTPITGRHPLLVEALDASGRALPRGVRVVVARGGLARWWFITGPQTRARTATIRATDLMSGIVAERGLKH